jgi:NDP-sugar pyrophosphorylase family protein
MKAMILAAGYGTRLRPVTYTMPKPMVPMCNRPLIGWAIESVLAAGVDEIIINLHHLPEQLEQYVREHYASRAALHFSLEEEILGTGGGIRRVRRLLEADEEFLLVNGDTVQFPRWAELIEARRAHGAVAALTLRHPPEGDRFTPVHFDGARVTGFGKGEGEPLMFAGSHVVSRRVFDLLPDRDFSGIVEHVYQPMLDARSGTIAGVVDDGLWFDVGTPQRYMSASRGLLQAMRQGVLQPPTGSTIAGDSLLHSSSDARIAAGVAGERSLVSGDVSDSVIWDDCRVDGDIRRTIVGHGVTLQGSFSDVMVCVDDSAIPAEYLRKDGNVVVPI